MALITLLTVSLIVFTLMELVPGTCAERYLAFKNTQGSQISIEDIAAEEKRLGLDRPFLVRWGSWVGSVFSMESLVIAASFGSTSTNSSPTSS